MTIKCKLCGAETHIMAKHLKESHEGVTIAEYQDKFPDAPIYSEKAKQALAKKRSAGTTSKAVEMNYIAGERSKSRKGLNETFGYPEDYAPLLSRKGSQIPVTVFDELEGDIKMYVPDIDPDYEFDAEALKVCMMGIETNKNVYLFGHAGTGKSTVVEQVHARTGRPIIRIQHSRDTEESHVVGLYVARNGETVWQPGILQICMRFGMTYLADEYDRAMPQVTSLYQAVLEGKSLIAKEAPEEWRVIKPHPDFRFFATGNTNGAGDESGLFVSTSLQDFANYERFALMYQMNWLDKDTEARMISKKSGIALDDAESMVKFATMVRKKVDEGEMTSPVSPRALINAAQVSLLYGDFKKGLSLAFLNRLNNSDREACSEVLKRFWS